MSGPASVELAGAAADKRIAALDGWRGVSILMVIFGHLVDYRYGGSSARIVLEFADSISTLGVCIFFVISGLIITKLALRDRHKVGSFSARKFYIRRLLRIVPPFYAYLLFVLALTALGAIGQHSAETLKAATFSCNLPDADCGWFGGHSWSLAYEEQFYLMFPLLFIAVGRELRIAVGLLLVTFVSVPLVRFALRSGPTVVYGHARDFFLVVHLRRSADGELARCRCAIVRCLVRRVRCTRGDADFVRLGCFGGLP